MTSRIVYAVTATREGTKFLASIDDLHAHTWAESESDLRANVREAVSLVLDSDDFELEYLWG